MTSDGRNTPYMTNVPHRLDDNGTLLIIFRVTLILSVNDGSDGLKLSGKQSQRG